jgi:hypothetical protein
LEAVKYSICILQFYGIDEASECCDSLNLLNPSQLRAANRLWGFAARIQRLFGGLDLTGEWRNYFASLAECSGIFGSDGEESPVTIFVAVVTLDSTAR